MKLTKKELAIIAYCKPYIDQMWAAKVVSIILDCDFRDVAIHLRTLDGDL